MSTLRSSLVAARLGLLGAGTAAAQEKKPNILVIFGDDVGQTNISAYSFGVVGYRTPNLDRLAREGLMFTDYYAENSCTAGRSTFITGQSPLRTGLSKVGLPGAPVGLQKTDITIAQALKPLGYMTGQFGKNHLNAEEEPERPYWPKDDPAFTSVNSPRGVLKCRASTKDDPTEQPHWGRVGRQVIEDTGALTKKRMETIDDETTAAAIDFMKRQSAAGKPFFTWMNFTRMHVFTHVRASMRGRAGMPGNEYADGMLEMDDNVGKLLKVIDDLKLADNTIVVFTTDNGPNQFTWPDAASTPFRSEKDTNWEGAFRVPAFVRWPGKIKPGTIATEMFSGLDWFPTHLAAAGDATVKDRLLKGWQPTGNPTSFRNHLDGFNQIDYLTGKSPKSARTEFVYFNDDGDLVAYSYNNWKAVFAEQKKPGGFPVWYEPFVTYRIPKLFNLRMDPYERADVVSDQYDQWRAENGYLMGEVTFHAAAFLETFKEYPPSQRPASFSLDQIRKNVDKVIDESFRKRGIE